LTRGCYVDRNQRIVVEKINFAVLLRQGERHRFHGGRSLRFRMSPSVNRNTRTAFAVPAFGSVQFENEQKKRDFGRKSQVLRRICFIALVSLEEERPQGMYNIAHQMKLPEGQSVPSFCVY